MRNHSYLTSKLNRLCQLVAGSMDTLTVATLCPVSFGRESVCCCSTDTHGIKMIDVQSRSPIVVYSFTVDGVLFCMYGFVVQRTLVTVHVLCIKPNKYGCVP